MKLSSGDFGFHEKTAGVLETNFRGWCEFPLDHLKQDLQHPNPSDGFWVGRASGATKRVRHSD